MTKDRHIWQTYGQAGMQKDRQYADMPKDIHIWQTYRQAGMQKDRQFEDRQKDRQYADMPKDLHKWQTYGQEACTYCTYKNTYGVVRRIDRNAKRKRQTYAYKNERIACIYGENRSYEVQKGIHTQIQLHMEE
jgi:hypothetical protein